MITVKGRPRKYYKAKDDIPMRNLYPPRELKPEEVKILQEYPNHCHWINYRKYKRYRGGKCLKCGKEFVPNMVVCYAKTNASLETKTKYRYCGQCWDSMYYGGESSD